MPRGTGRLTLDNFVGGLNVRDDPVNLPSNESPAVTDFVPYGEGGAIVQREGDSSFQDVGQGTNGPIFYSPEVGAVLALTMTAAKIMAGATTVYDPGGFPPSLAPTDFAPVAAPVSGGQGPVYFRMVNSAGVNVFRYWTGAGASAAWTAATGTIPTTKYLFYAGNRVWAYGSRVALSSATNARIFWSDVGDPRSWPVANVLQLDPGDGEDILAMGRVGDVLVAFKSSKAWVIYDLDTGANRPLGEDVGVKPFAALVCTTPIGLFFIDPSRGPMTTDGTTTRELENGTKAPWDSFAAAAYANQHIYCTAPYGAADKYLYDYDLATRSWWRHSTVEAYRYFAVDEPNGRLFGAREDDDKIDRLLSGGTTKADDTTAILPSWDSTYFGLGAPTERKRLRSMKVVGAGNAAVKLKLEVAGSFTTLKTGALEAPGLVVPTPGVARAPQFEIVKSSGATLARLDQVVVDYSVRQK